MSHCYDKHEETIDNLQQELNELKYTVERIKSDCCQNCRNFFNLEQDTVYNCSKCTVYQYWGGCAICKSDSIVELPYTSERYCFNCIKQRLDKIDESLSKKPIIEKESKMCMCCQSMVKEYWSWSSNRSSSNNNDSILVMCKDCVFELCIESMAKKHFKSLKKPKSTTSESS